MKLVSAKNTIALFYYLMSVDSNVTEVELQKLDDIVASGRIKNNDFTLILFKNRIYKRKPNRNIPAYISNWRKRFLTLIKRNQNIVKNLI